MTGLKAINPPDWTPAKGYANGVLAPDGTLQVAGQIGWEGDQVFRAHDFIGQSKAALFSQGGFYFFRAGPIMKKAPQGTPFTR